MSHNQARGERTARPHPPNNHPRSFRKNNSNNNAQGGQNRGAAPPFSTNSSNQSLVHMNGSHLQHRVPHGVPSNTGATAPIEQVDLSAPKAADTVPRPPPSGISAAHSGISTLGTPAKAPGGSSPRSITLQFGSMSPNVVNGMHIPARTSSAPPNIDEQKRDQARHQASGNSHNFPTPSIPKQHFPKLDVGTAERHTTAVESHSTSKSKADEQPSVVPASSQIPKPFVQPPSRIPVPLTYHQQQQVSLQYNGPPPQMQSQVTVPMHIPMNLPIGDPQPPMFVTHPMQPPGLMHQGQGFNFSPHMPHMPPMPPQLGNMGMSMSLQFHQQRPQKFGSRKVKITHPDTHEELRFDSSSGSRSHPNMPPQSQHVPSFQRPQLNSYPNSFPAPGSLPVGSTQVNSHPLPQRSHNKVTVKVPGGSNKERDTALSTGVPLSVKDTRPNTPSFTSVPVPIIKSAPESALNSKDTATSKPASIHSEAASEEDSAAGQKQEDFVKAVVVTDQQEKEVDHSVTDDQLQVDRLPATSSTSQASQFECVEVKSTAPTLITELVKSDKESVSTATESMLGKASIIDSAESRQVEPDISPLVEGAQPEGINNVVAVIPVPVNKFHSPCPSTTEAAEVSTLDTHLSKAEANDPEDAFLTRSSMPNLDSAYILGPNEVILRHDVKVGEIKKSDLISPTSVVQDKVFLEADVLKDAAPKGGKKKLKDIIKRADAAGATSDLYMAYKGADEKNQNMTSVVSGESISSESVNQICNNDDPEDAIPNEKDQIKVEPDDWEDAADISTPQIEPSEHRNKSGSGLKNSADGEVMIKKYSRDFLLKFSERSTDPPEGFEITSDIAQALMASNANVSRESNPSSGRTMMGGTRPDRRMNIVMDEDKWSKVPGPLVSERDIGAARNIIRYQPGPGGNFGVLRGAPRAQMHSQYPGPLLPGLMQPPGPHGANQRNNIDSDRWQRGTNFQKGLMPYPQTPPPIIHRAENKYLVGKVTDEEQAKQRQLKGILNKLTPQNFEKLFQQVKEVNIDNDVTLTGVISQIFDKALTEPTFCEMYADFCYHLAADLPDLSVGNEKITFKRLLLNKCQEEFGRGEREQEEANKAELEGEVKQSEGEREEKRLLARRRMLGNIRLIGELYKKRMLTERIMHECIKKLLGGPGQIPDEEDLEALCKLMSTIGEMIDHPKAKEHMDVYFDMMTKLSTNMKLSSRVRFMLLDAIDLRKNKWQQRRKVEGPKKIDEVHRDAAQERQAQTSRLSRAPSFGNPSRRGQPMDFGPRVSSGFSSPGSQTGGPRPTASHPRSFGGQDARFEDRHHTENRILSVPLPPRTDNSLTLGPQGGLGRGMSYRGHQSSPSTPLADTPGSIDSRRMGSVLNGFSAMPDREDSLPRNMQERIASQSIYDQPSTQDPKSNYGKDGRIADYSLERTKPTSPSRRDAGPSPERFPEERLRDMSLAAIREFYSAKDENEVTLCIKELNAPSYYPSMIQLWVTDSFERKDMERNLLARLIVNIVKSRDQTISEDQLISGFEYVLSTLEDAVTDAPKATEFLGHLFAHVISENVISLAQIGKLIYEGGEEQGRLVEIGLAAEVLGTILERINSENGDTVLAQIQTANLQLKNFRPPGSSKPCKIDKFI